MVPKGISYEVYTSSFNGAKAILADLTDAAFWVCGCYKRLPDVAGREENWGSEDLKSSPRFAASQFPNLGFLLIKLYSTDIGEFSMNLCFFFFSESHFKNNVDSYFPRKTTTKVLLREFSFYPFFSERCPKRSKCLEPWGDIISFACCGVYVHNWF